MRKKFLVRLLYVIIIIIIMIISYLFIITAYAEEKSKKQEDIQEIIICELGNWVDSTKSGIILENNIYRCGDEFNVCDLVEGNKCKLSREFKVVIEGGNHRTEVNFALGDSVSVQVKRNRWYGEIIGNGEREDLNIFNIGINLPMRVGGENIEEYHISFLILMGFVLIYFLLAELLYSIKRRRINKWQS